MKTASCLAWTVFGVTLLCGCGAKPDGAAKPTPPAKVDKIADEKKLNTITLTQAAEDRLQIKLVEVRMARVARKRTVGGEIIVPPGNTITVVAPLTGRLAAPAGGNVPVAGTHVKQDQPLFSFTPLLSPERDVLTPAERVNLAQAKATLATSQIDAERQVESAKLEHGARKIAYERALQLFNDKAGSQRTLDESKAQRDLAEAALATAQARHQLLSKISLDADAGVVNSQTIGAPVAGILKSVDAAPGETVNGGKALFQIIRSERVWVRSPLFVGQVREINEAQAAQVSSYGQSPKQLAVAAEPVQAPPSANPLTSTVDLYYELDNAQGRFVPGERVAVTLPVRGEAEHLVAPWSAVLFDYHGATWVYEQTAPLTYVRRRVDVLYVDGANAVLGSGPAAGAKLVTDGAAELFGAEFGNGK